MNEQLKNLLRQNHLLRSIVYTCRRFLKKLELSVTGKNNQIIRKGVLHRVRFDIKGDNNSVLIGEGSSLTNVLIVIRGKNHRLVIGSNCHLKGGSICFEDEDCEIVIGMNTTIESAQLAVTEPGKKILIGTDCMLADAIQIRTGDSHSIIEVETKKRINPARDIVIENHVWIGANAVILKGVTIGSNSIVGIHSLVTKSIPPNSIAAGIPAKVLKSNIDWMRERTYD